MRIKKIKPEYFQKNPNITQQLEKTRGYGVVTVFIKNLMFGIPLHSNIDNRFGFATKEENGKLKGLNYQKAILISENDLSSSFKIPHDEFDKIQDNSNLIKEEFERYIAHYLLLIEQKKYQQANREYRKSTLVNYYRELGILYKQQNILLNSLSTLC